MVITNDVSLITFVPFGLIVLRMAAQERLAVPLVILQTLAANLGSMLTPMGNHRISTYMENPASALASSAAICCPMSCSPACCLQR